MKKFLHLFSVLIFCTALTLPGCETDSTELLGDGDENYTGEFCSTQETGDNGTGTGVDANGDASSDSSLFNQANLKYNTWLRVEIPGTVCGNGTQYKFFVNLSKKQKGESQKKLVIYLEAGGACWDYASCTGATGIRGAANPNGVPDNYMVPIVGSVASLMSPFVFRNHPWDSVPTKDWDIIFIPYCTGDIHTGNNEITYVDEETGKLLPWHHNGHRNMLAVIDWINENYTEIPNLLVTGSSAGGIGSLVNYYFIREGLGEKVWKSTLLNDSGPAYPAADEFDGNLPEDLAELDPDSYPHSLPLHRKIKIVWDLNSVLDILPPEFADPMSHDMGVISELLARHYPTDRIAHTQFTRDGNYSGYSYERFYEEMNSEILHQYWYEDQENLMDQYDSLHAENGNTGYFIPYFRAFNESHCTCVLDFTDTDISDVDMDMKDYIVDLLDPTIPLASYFETPSDEELYADYPVWDFMNLLMENL